MKHNNINGMIRLFTIAFCILIASCSGKKNYAFTVDKTAYAALKTHRLYLDTLAQIEQKSLLLDSLDFTQFYETEDAYHLLYHNYGKHSEYAISLHSISDTVITAQLLKKTVDKWERHNTVNLEIVGFSPAYFSAVHKDYNLDGVNDLYLIFYNSMSVGDAYGHLLTISKEEDKLRLIENAIAIPNLFMEKGKIRSLTYNHPGHETEKYAKTEHYQIVNDQLVLQDSNIEYFTK